MSVDDRDGAPGSLLSSIVREGTAAHSMRGEKEGLWADTQENTFRNWVNEQLRETDLEIENFSEGFADGVKLCALIQSLRDGKKLGGRVVQKPFNHHQKIQNATLALKAMQEDKIKLVNIGPEDVVNGNVKLILGLVWASILHYQIGKSKIPPKKLMLAWVQAVIPECSIRNFGSDWQDGKALHALIDFCKPGLSPDWKSMRETDRLANCTSAMNLAAKHFKIPKLVSPEDFTSKLDDFTGMTYLSYFMRLNSPGLKATLERLNARNPAVKLNNFSTDWMDGSYLCSLVDSVGGQVTGWPNVPRNDPVACTQLGLTAAKELGVDPLLKAVEMTDTQGEHLGVMAYAAAFINLKVQAPRAPANKDRVMLLFDSTNVVVEKKNVFKLCLLSGNVDDQDIHVSVTGPNGEKEPVNFNWDSNKREAEGFLMPRQAGIHKMEVTCNEDVIKQCPVTFTVVGDKTFMSVMKKDLVVLGSKTGLEVTSNVPIERPLTFELTDPTGSKTTKTVSPAEGKIVAVFDPAVVGKWSVGFLKSSEHISGSPFPIEVIDPTKVKVHDPQGGVIGEEISFLVDTSSAGRGRLECVVDHNGRVIQCTKELQRSTQKDGDRYKVVFMPRGAGLYKIRVSYGGFPCSAEPLSIEIANANMVSATGEGLSSVRVGHVTYFDVHTRGAGTGELEITILDPKGDSVKAEKQFLPASESYHVQYVPRLVGNHTATLAFAGKQVKGSPFTVVACNPLKCLASVPRTGYVGQPVNVEITATEAGKGNLEIMVNDGTTQCEVKALGNKCWSATFVPEDVGPVIVEMNFNGTAVPGSPWTVNVSHQPLPPPPPIEPTAAPVVSHQFRALAQVAPVRESRYFEVSSSEVEVKILAPSSKFVPFTKKPTVSGGVAVEYAFEEIGQHTVHIMHAGKNIKGSPFVVQVYDPTKVKVSPMVGVSPGQVVEFTVDTTGCGVGEVEAKVDEGKVTCAVSRVSEGVYRGRFQAGEPGRHEVNVFFNKMLVPGSPFPCPVAHADIHSLLLEVPRQVSIHQTQYAVIHAPAIQPHLTAVKVTAPNNELIASSLTPNGPDEIKVEYRSPHVGRHTVDIFYRGAKMGGSPYYVEVFDPQRVRFERVESQVYLNESTEVEVVADNAGTADIECRVMTPTGRPVPCDLVSNGNRLKGRYTPSEQGAHTVHVYIGGVEIPGSPKTQVVEVRQQPSPPQPVSSRPVDLSRITVEGEGLYLGRKGKPCPIIIKLHGASPGDKPAIRVEGPHSVANSTVEPVAEGIYHASYVPAEVGTFSVALSWKGQPIPGSPFQPRVVDPGAMRIVNGLSSVLDQGRLPLTVGRETCIHVDATGCGAGALHAQVKDSAGNRIKVECKETTAGMYSVAFTPPAKREYTLTFFWGDLPVPGAPLSGYAKADVPLHPSKVLVSGTGLTLATVGKTAEFFMDGSKAGPGRPTVSLRAGRPGDPDIQVQCTQRSDGVYSCSYVPPVTGPYDLHLGWSNQRLPSSPYKLIVRGTPQPAMVRMEKGEWSAESPSGGPSAKGAKTMVMSHAINTKMAGPGELVARCRGPTKVAMCSLEAHGEGAFTLLVKPQEAGLHRLEVTYSGEHIPGSPQEFDFEAPFDPSKVIVKGAGVQHGILAAFQSRFTVDTKDAGEGSLTVKVRGPKGGFNVSMDRESERSIVCSYDPTEVGLYIISVQWSGESVPQSPFYVRIFDTYEELDRFIKTGRLPQEIARERSMQRSVKVAPRGRSLYSMTTPPPQVVPAGRPVVVGPPPQVLVNGPPPQVVMNGPPPQVVMNGPPPQLRHVQRVPTQHQRRAMSMKVNGYPYQGY